MSPTKQGRKIALVGASGNLGKPTLSGLLAQKIHTVTIIQRNESTASYPPEVSVKQGALDDEAFLVGALQGQEVLVLQLSRFAMGIQPGFIRAAAKAGVKYVLPVEFGSDPDSRLVDEFDMLAHKRAPRELISELGVSSWIAVVTNPWLDYGFLQNAWGIQAKERKAALWGGGNTKVNTVSIKRAGEATAELLSLPEAELEKFRNRAFFVTSLHVTQREIFESVLRATKTTEQDWEITTPDMDDVAKECDELLKVGDMRGFVTKFYMSHFRDGSGGDFNDKSDTKKFELAGEDLDKVIAESL